MFCIDKYSGASYAIVWTSSGAKIPESLPDQAGARCNSDFSALETGAKGSGQGDSSLTSVVGGVDTGGAGGGLVDVDDRRVSSLYLDVDVDLLRVRADPLVLF